MTLEQKQAEMRERVQRRTVEADPERHKRRLQAQERKLRYDKLELLRQLLLPECE